MKTNLEFEIDRELFSKFSFVANYLGEEKDQILEGLVKNFIQNFFLNEAKNMKVEESSIQSHFTISKQQRDYSSQDFLHSAKALNRIPKWAMNPNQINFKILAAFFHCEKTNNGYVTKKDMLNYLIGKNCGIDAFKFNGNFAAMCTDAANSHGKVFESQNGSVSLALEAKEVAREYEKYFYL